MILAQKKEIKNAVADHVSFFWESWPRIRRMLKEGTTNTKGRSYSESNTPGLKDRSNIKCFKCDEMGHVASVCPKGHNKYIEKRVDVCETK